MPKLLGQIGSIGCCADGPLYLPSPLEEAGSPAVASLQQAKESAQGVTHELIKNMYTESLSSFDLVLGGYIFFSLKICHVCTLSKVYEKDILRNSVEDLRQLEPRISLW